MAYSTANRFGRGHGSVLASGDITFDSAIDVDPATDEITATAHGLLTGDAVRLSDDTNTAPVGLLHGQLYFVIEIDEDTIQLADTLKNANAGVNIDITADGTGVNTLMVADVLVVERSAQYFSIMVGGTNMLVRYTYDITQSPVLWKDWDAGVVSEITESTFEGGFHAFAITGEGSYAYSWD